MSILKFLGWSSAQPSSTNETETVRKIAQKLDQIPEEQARFIAAFAYLLSRAARGDHVDLDGNLLLAEDPWPGVAFEDGVQLPSDQPGLGVHEAVSRAR
jgi:hypothetical protein